MTTGLKPFIGITGGIGSGKSTICRIFSCLGIPVFEADKAAREICDQDTAVKEAIIAEFGPKAYLPDGSYNRAWIKGLLQKYPGDVAHLNAIIHPAVRQKATEWFASTPDAPFCLYESALITPQKKPEPISHIITVDAPLNERIQSIQKRSKISYMETMQMIDLQPKPKNYLWGADFVIQNGKNDQVFPQVMNILKAFTCFVLLLVGPSATAQLKAMTFNIRMDTESDGINQWKYRAKHCGELIRYHKADIIGLQEAFLHQITDLEKELTGFGWFGKGRDDGKAQGEFSALMYRKSKFKLMKESTFWLSDSCDKVGFGWDAACRRVVTWGQFQERKTGKKFFVFNTHFDHLGKVARRESAKLVLRKIAEIAGKTPVILTGDFNATPEDEPIQILVDTKNPARVIDTEKISRNGHYGPYSSFNGFTKEQEGRHIDYIFVKNGPVVLQHTTHSETWENKYPTDHFPVSAVIRIP
jgi:dephospho-CoA kinase